MGYSLYENCLVIDQVCRFRTPTKRELYVLDKLTCESRTGTEAKEAFYVMLVSFLYLHHLVNKYPLVHIQIYCFKPSPVSLFRKSRWVTKSQKPKLIVLHETYLG